MSDFTVQFVEGIIPASTSSVDINSPTFDQLKDVAKAFFIPAVYPQQTACIGRTTGTIDDSFFNIIGHATLVDLDTVRFTDGSTKAVNTRCGTNLLEYVGPTGGPNEVIVRAIKTFTAAVGVDPAESSAITGISNINNVVPFAFMYGDANGPDYRNHFASVEVVNNGTNNVVRVHRQQTTDGLNFVVYVVEFVGSNWTIQKVSHTFAAGNTNEDVTISSVPAANSFVYSTLKSTGNTPAQNLFYVWQTSNTNLRHRVLTLAGTVQQTISYVISNPQLSVQHVGADPDGTSDIAATGTEPETRNVSCSAVPDITQAMVTGFCGQDTATATSRTATPTLFNLTTTTNIQLRRGTSVGGSEYKLSVIDWSAVSGGQIDSVSQITAGQSFTIVGSFGSSPTVKINGVTQTVTASNSTSITCTAVLGSNRYDTEYTLTVAFGGVTISPADPVTYLAPVTADFVTLLTLANTANRITASGDLAVGDQIEWSLVVGGGTSDVIVYNDAAFSVAAGVSAFTVRIHDGNDWGISAVQQVAAPVPPKTRALSCPTPTPL